MNDFEAHGYILDLSGSGEGIIGRMKPKQVVAIDLYKRELEELPAGPLKIVMDARDLKFLDGSFRTATAFFMLMYVKPADHEKIFQEVFRVLAPGGRFLVWDVILPPRPADVDKAKDMAVFPFLFKLPSQQEIKTGYGTFFPPAVQDLRYYTHLAERAGFRASTQNEKGRTFFLELRKP